MSDLSPEQNLGGFGWPSLIRMSVPGNDPLRHAILLQRCFDGSEMRWTDALVARTRRHAGGCLSAVEMSLRLEMAARRPDLVKLIEAFPADYCWTRTQQEHDLIEPESLLHFRDRAAVGLIQQDPFLASAGQETAASASISPFPTEIADMLSGLLLAQAGWADRGPDETPMRPDLPAEEMSDLVWTVAAIVARGLVGVHDGAPGEIMTLVDRSGEALIARHDEQSAPYAMASLLAHRLRGGGLGEEELGYMARGGHALALLAVIADRLAIELPVLARVAIECSEKMLFALCRAAQFPREVAVRLVLGRKCVVHGVDDSKLVEYADDYDHLDPSLAAASLAGLGVAAPLRAKLARFIWSDGV